MKAIEKNFKTDSKGNLKLDIPLTTKERNVRVIILLDEEDDNEEKIWLEAVSNNPAFEFLKDTSEDIYTLESGKQFNG